MTLAFQMSDPQQRAAGLAAASAALRRGELVALPVDSGYALVADAFSDRGVAALRAARGRPGLRPQVLVGRVRAVAGIAEVTPVARSLMTDHWPGLLTLLLLAHPSLAWRVAPPGAAVAVRMPMHPVALELAGGFGPLAAVPAGPPGTQALESADEVRVGLPTAMAVLLDGGTVARLPGSTIVDATCDPPLLVRPGAVGLAELASTCPDIGHSDSPAPAGT